MSFHLRLASFSCCLLLVACCLNVAHVRSKQLPTRVAAIAVKERAIRSVTIARLLDGAGYKFQRIYHRSYIFEFICQESTSKDQKLVHFSR